MTERVKFFTVNALSVLVFAVILVQTYIYRRQWEAMQKQLTARNDQTVSMGESLAETRNMAEQNRRAIKATERGVEVAQQNMIYAQRAYITITDGEIIRPIRDLLFKMTIRNSGNTPAYDVQVARKVDIPEILPDPNTDWQTWSRVGLIAPHGEIEMFAPALNNVTNQQEQLIAMGRLKTYCWGMICYRDIFGKTRYTKFCFSDRLGEAVSGHAKAGMRLTNTNQINLYQNRFFVPKMGLAQNPSYLPKKSKGAVTSRNKRRSFWASPPSMALHLNYFL